jgi:lactate permease
MTNTFFALLAFAPIGILFILMVWARWPAVKAMPVAWAVTMVLVYFVWNVPFNWLMASEGNPRNPISILQIARVPTDQWKNGDKIFLI